MGMTLRIAADAAIEAAPRVGKRRDDAMPDSLGPFERLAISYLANKARDETGIAWPGHLKIANYVGCSENTVAPTLAALAARGHISIMPDRKGVFAVYLVHPGGRAAAGALNIEAVRRHLGRGNFTRAGQDAVLAWLASLGMLEIKDAVAALCRGAALDLSASRKAPPTIGGATNISPPNGWDKHPQPTEPAPPTDGAESIREPEKEPTAIRAATTGDEATAPPVDAVPSGEPHMHTARPRRVRQDWTGEPSAVLERASKEGWAQAAKLGAMPREQALEAIKRQQQLMGAQGSHARAAA